MIAKVDPRAGIREDIVAKLSDLLDKANAGDVISFVGVVEYRDGYFTNRAGITDKFRMMGALTAAAVNLAGED